MNHTCLWAWIIRPGSALWFSALSGPFRWLYTSGVSITIIQNQDFQTWKLAYELISDQTVICSS